MDFSMIDGFNTSHKPFISTDPSYKNLTGGMLIGPMIEGYYIVMWYNSALASKMGLNIKTTGMTFDDFLSYIKW
ncbi:MAG: hypothetical protein HC906_16440 [Bacteroidales bacterium]|nr:hypothetical protein [Bacteroidales bacterium]